MSARQDWRGDDLMADQPLGTTRRWESEPLFPDLFPGQVRQVIEVTKPAPHVKLPERNGSQRRDEGMQSAWENTPANWRTVAMTLLYQLCRSQPEITTDDLQAVLPPLPSEAHHNVIGGLWMEGVRHHIIRRTDRTITSTRPSAHARRVPIYESLIFNG
jgi:hypothetical protein